MHSVPADVLFLDGADAIAFAHAQFTSDVKALECGRWQWSAWLDAQGRARHFFLLARTRDQQLMAWQPLGDAHAMRAGLAPYVFRSKLRLEVAQWHLGQPLQADAAPAANEVLLRDDGFLVLLPGSEPRLALLSPDRHELEAGFDLPGWRAADISAGLPLLAPEVSGRFVPQALDLERLDAIRFDKGCYPGQEVAARLHFRGGNKRRLQRIADPSGPSSPGSPVFGSEGSEIGMILYSAHTNDGHMALAVVRDEQNDNDKSSQGN